MVEDVVGFQTNLQRRGFGEGEALGEGRIPLVDAVGAQVREHRREGADVVLERVGRGGNEVRCVEGRAVDLSVVQSQRGGAEVDVVAGAGGTAVDPHNGRAHLVGVDVVQQPAADQRVGDARVQVQLLALAHGEFVRHGKDVTLWMVYRGDALFGDRVGIVEPGHLLHHARIDVVEHEGKAVGSAFFKADVEAIEIGAAVAEVLLEDSAASTPTGGGVADGELGVPGQKLGSGSGGRILAGLQAGERVGGRRGEIVLAGVPDGQRAEELPRDAIELGVIDRQMDGVIANVGHFEHQVFGEAVLHIEGPAERIRAFDHRVDEGHALAGEGQQTERVAARRQEAAGEWVTQRRQRGEVVITGSGERSGLAEAFLVGIRAGGELIVHAHGGDGHRRDEHSEAAANHGLAVQGVGGPRNAYARADQVGVVLINRGLAVGGEGQSAQHIEGAGWKLREGSFGIGCLSGGGQRIGGGSIEAVHRAAVFFVVGAIVIEAHPEIESEVVLDSPIVLEEHRAVVGIPGGERVEVVTAAGRQAEHEGREVLSDGDGGGGAAGRAHETIIEGESSGGSAGGEGIQAVLSEIAAGLQGVVAFGLLPCGEDLIGLGRQLVGAGGPESRQAGRAVERDYRHLQVVGVAR